jgi:hypothetical protein
MDEVIEHCGGDCSTEWWHMSGGGVGSITTVPVPPALWLFGSGLLVICRSKLRFDPINTVAGSASASRKSNWSKSEVGSDPNTYRKRYILILTK